MARTKSRPPAVGVPAECIAVEKSKSDDESVISQLQKILDAQEASFGPYEPRLADTLSTLAVIYEAAGDLGNAQSALSRAIEIRSRSFGKDNLVVAQTMTRQAELYERSGELPHAERLYIDALTCTIRHFGLNDS